jgi:putative ABC transport system permease protein
MRPPSRGCSRRDRTVPDPLIPTRSHESIAADNQAELEGWIAERAAQLSAGGMDPEQARRRAVEEFGDFDAATRYAVGQDVAADRRVRLFLWIEELVSDLRIAARTLARTPTVAAVVLLTFALGTGATTAVFSVFHAMLLRPLPYGEAGTLFHLAPRDNGVVGLNPRHSATALKTLRERTTVFTGIAGITSGNVVMTEGGDPEQVTGASVTGNAFDVLQVRAAIGRTFGLAEEESPVVILGDALWRRRFGADPGIVGRTIDLWGERHEIIGVMPRDFRVPTYEQAEFLTPQTLGSILENPNSAHVRFMALFGRVKPGASSQVAQEDVSRVMRGLQLEFPQSFSGLDTRVVPIRTAVAGNVRPRLLVLMGAAAFVLLIACANVAGILLSRALARRHELSVRIALGAGRSRLIRQFLAEGAALGVLGAGLGLLVAQIGVAALRQIAATALPPGTTFALEPGVLVFAIGIAIVGALAASLVALVATQVPGVALRSVEGRATMSRATRRLRLGLVGGQLAVSVVLLIGAGLFLRALQRLSAVDLGYAPDHAVTFRLQFTRQRSPAEQDVFWETLYRELRGLPGVTSAGGGNVPMAARSTVTGLEIEGRPVENGRLPEVRYTPASDDYFAALGIPLIRGRRFEATDRASASAVAIVSEGLARQLWPNGDPIGARVRTEPDKPWTTIVGIAGDVRMAAADEAQPTIYTSQRQDHWPGGGAVVVRTGEDPGALIPALRQAVKRVDPTMPLIGLSTLEEFRQRTPAIAERRLQMQLLLVFALVALVVSAIGVYGVSAYATEARRREFGIRMALGASRRSVLWLALRDGAHVGLIGALVGIPIAWLLANRLRDLLYEVAPFDPVTVGVVLGTLLLIVLAASAVPARRATLIDPARTLRTD